MNEHTQSAIYDLAQTPSGEIIIEENAPGGVVLARFYRPGVGNLPIKKIVRVLPGGDGQASN